MTLIRDIETGLSDKKTKLELHKEVWATYCKGQYGGAYQVLSLLIDEVERRRRLETR